MQYINNALLVAIGLVFSSPLLRAADTTPTEPPAAARSTAAAVVPAAWPIAPPGAPFDRELSPDDDIPSVQVPANQIQLPPAVIDLTTAPTSLWTRIRLGFGLPDVSSPLVRAQEEWFANRPDYIKRTIARSSLYLHYIVEEIQKRGMPTEIALLPIVESAYNPVAYSRAHASGIWQFIPSTGKLYGLQQNFWYDGRRDVMAATNAALDYLQKLYEMFGSWDLALASYNWGDGAVSRAITKNQVRGLPTDYQNLTMPNETRYYIPKLQAVKNIVADPAQYGIELAEVPNQPYFVAVTTTKHIDVKLAARLADVPLEEFVSLNPGYSRPVIRANSEQTLLVPADKADTFRVNLENNSQPLVSWQAYKLKPGESMDRIASRHGISVAQLKQVNGISGKRRVGTGATLLVPASGNAAPHLPDLPAPPVTGARTPKKSGKYTQAARKGGTVKVSAQTRKTTKKPASAPAKKTTTNGTKKIVLAQETR